MIDFVKLFEYPIYQVGGCVRDELLGLPIKDIDLASDLSPTDFKNLCAKLKLRTHDTGIEHGTVTVLIKGASYEHTTFRCDVSCDGRNATVSFSKTIEEDLSRRDFTINAMAKLGDKLIDPFGGQEDLAKRILRTVGDPEKRFSEDFLRIIRAARFISRLNFTADEELVKAANKLSPEIIKHVSIERVVDEIRKVQKNVDCFFKVAKELGFLNFILEKAAVLSSAENEKWMKILRNSSTKNELLYFSAILLPLYGEMAQNKGMSWRLSRHILQGMKVIEGNLALFKQDLTPITLRRAKQQVKDYFADLKIYCCEILEDERSQATVAKMQSFEKLVDTSLDNPIINGDFLQSQGLKPSPKFKGILDECGELQASGASIAEVEKLAMILIQKALG